jgi:DNA-binding GntR family transcriptional regulator
MKARTRTGRARPIFGARPGTEAGRSLGQVRISRATLTSQLEEALRTDIVTGLLEPGQKLRATNITALYGVSATPIREAVQRLSGQGLVELDPKIGARVASISLEDVKDVFAVRLILEPRALELSIAGGNAAWLRDMTESFERLRSATSARRATNGARWREAMLEAAEAHRAFHWALLSACGSPWLLRFISILFGHTSRYRMLLVRGRDHPAWLRGHQAILDAARRRDAKRAVRVQTEHTRQGLDMLVRSYGNSTRRRRS